MNTISKSAMTIQQHAKLAQHYHNRHFAIACTQIIGKSPARQILLDYTAIYQKYLHHKRAAETLRAIEAQQRTEAGLLALGTVTPDTSKAIKINAANVQVGRTYYQHGGTNPQAFTVISITDDYQRQPAGGIYRLAQVKLANGETAEKRIYASQRYVEIEVS